MPSSPYALILDDHPLVGRGMAQYLQSCHDLDLKVASCWEEGQQLIQRCGSPLILVADIWLPDGNSLRHLVQWRGQCPDSPWLATSGDDDPRAGERAREAGARGFVHKQAAPEQLRQAFSAVLNGGLWFAEPATAGEASIAPRDWPVTAAELGLTARQGEILDLLLRGLSNKRIALALSISENTVKEHVTAILDRLKVRTRIEAITAMRGRCLAASGSP